MRLKRIILSLLAIYAIAFFFELDDKIYSKMLRIANDVKGIKERIDLDRYEVQIEAKKIKSIEDNLSGITYSPKTKTLFSITNSPRKIYELDLNGNLLRTIDLKGFKDTEGITYIKDNIFAIIDERKSGIYVFEINKDTKILRKENVIKKFHLKINSYKNFGYEGVAYNKEDDIFFIANEMFSKEIILLRNWFKDKNRMEVSLEGEENSVIRDMMDLSGLHYNSKYKRLLVLSHESKLLIEVNNEGDKISYLDLEYGFGGLKNDILQAEGVTMDDDGNIYIVSEPNLFYKFKK